MTLRLAVFAVLILLLSVSSTGASPPPKPTDFQTGCYELSAIKWEPDPKGDAKYLTVPKRIWLSDYASPVQDNAYFLLPAPGQTQTIHIKTFWTIDAKEVHLKWGAGPAGSGVLIILQRPSEKGER